MNKKIKMNRETGALVTLDQSVAYDIIPHDILEKKLKHIGIENETVKMIMSYLNNRKQYVQINSNNSDILLTGDISVSQGSVMSGILYTIYILDMHHQTHAIAHTNHKEYNMCRNTHINTFVDDCYAILKADKNKIWNKIEKYILLMNQYYTNKRLQNNIKKTNVMIITDDKNIEKQNLKFQGLTLENKTEIKILGTIFNNKLNWNTHINEGRMSLIAQLKRRYSSI